MAESVRVALPRREFMRRLLAMCGAGAAANALPARRRSAVR